MARTVEVDEPVDYSATLRLVSDEHGKHCVVDSADATIWVGAELMDEVRSPDRLRYRGDLEVDGDLLTFGTEGEGLGRLRYRLTGERVEHGAFVAERVDEQREA